MTSGHHYPTLSDLSRQIQSPFARLRDLLAGIEPGRPAIDMTIGEPRHPFPAFVAPLLNAEVALYGRYPPIRGTDRLRGAIAAWLARRYRGLAGSVDAERHILPLSGSREGLFSAIFPAVARRTWPARPAVLMPNPFYQAYLAAALAGGAEPVFLPAEAETGFLPDLDAIPGDILARTAVLYLASPANPQGAVADHAYLGKAVACARRHDFLLFVDECYSEIHFGDPPPGALETALAAHGDFANVVVFNSLSKRSNVPGLRSGFAAGDSDFLDAFARFRNVACPQMPLPVQQVSAALWGDEAHVEGNRALYRQKFAAAETRLGGLTGYNKPQGGFFLWLEMTRFGGGEAAAARFWQYCGVKMLPGAYLAHARAQDRNPGAAYVRLALVDDVGTTETALGRIAEMMS